MASLSLPRSLTVIIPPGSNCGWHLLQTTAWWAVCRLGESIPSGIGAWTEVRTDVLGWRLAPPSQYSWRRVLRLI
eukprot:8512788-Pyramimonas_sp.AAC.1